MLVKDFDFILPEELIAQTPLSDRSASRLMLVDKHRGLVGETIFADIGSWLRRGDLLVVNDSRVIPARLIGRKDTGAEVELLLLEQLSATSWIALARPGRRLQPGSVVTFGHDKLRATIRERLPEGERLVEFAWDRRQTFPELLDALGEMPLPPYIHEPLQDRERYQTVYSRAPGSAAAPTAGLHFTPELMRDLGEQGVELARVTLQIGLGTFRPVKVEDIRDHVMHVEQYDVDAIAAGQVNRAKEEGRRIIAVGTTSCRVLESVSDALGRVTAGEGQTGIFIAPGYRFKAIDGLITNFHLPKSTLLMLVAALAGRENILDCYAEAVRQCYRFFSFGDAMFIADHNNCVG